MALKMYWISSILVSIFYSYVCLTGLNIMTQSVRNCWPDFGFFSLFNPSQPTRRWLKTFFIPRLPLKLKIKECNVKLLKFAPIFLVHIYLSKGVRTWLRNFLFGRLKTASSSFLGQPAVYSTLHGVHFINKNSLWKLKYLRFR